MNENQGSQTNLQIKVETGSADAHIWQVLGTVLACGAFGMIAYALAEAGWLEIASSAVTMLMFTMARLLWHAGMIRVPKKSGSEGDFEVTRSTAKAIYNEFQVWQAKSGVFRLFALALAYTVLFVVARQGVAVALGVFSNPWIAGAGAALIASLIVAPTMVSKLVDKLKASGVRVTSQAPAESEK